MAGIASGVGGYVAIANGSNNGSQYYGVGAQYSAPSRFLPVKTAPGTYDPHIVQGGPYVRNGAYVDLGVANVGIYLDAKLPITGDCMYTGLALLLNQVFGGSQAGAQAAALTQLGSTTAYALCAAGAQGTQYAVLQPQDGSWIDAEVRVQDTGGNAHYQQYHSGKVTKAEFVFPRDNIVTYGIDLDFAYVAFAGAQASGSEPANPVPFTMPNSSSLFQIGGAAVDGVKKATITFTPKLATERIYIGNQYKEEPVTNALVDVMVALEMDYTPTANSAIFQYFVPHTPLGAQFSTGDAVIIEAVGAEIGSSGFYNTFGFTFPQLFIMSGGEAPLKGLDIIGNTINLKATLDTYGDYGAYATLITADTTF